MSVKEFEEVHTSPKHLECKELKAEVERLTEALNEIAYMRNNRSAGDIAELLFRARFSDCKSIAIKALSTTNNSLYSARQAVIDAVNHNSGTLLIVAQSGHFGAETVSHILRVHANLERIESEQNRGGDNEGG